RHSGVQRRGQSGPLAAHVVRQKRDLQLASHAWTSKSTDLGTAGFSAAPGELVLWGTSEEPPIYFAHISQRGPVRYDQVPCSIGVLESLDNPMPIGEASCRTHGENGLAVWTLRIGKQEIPGRWIIVDRAFRPT